MRHPPQYCDLHCHGNIGRWDEGIPLGNGAMGALLWGSADALRLSMDRTDIWDTTPFPGTALPEFTYANLVRHARTGDEAEIRRIFDAPYENTTPCKLPVGRIVLCLPQTEQMEYYLSLERAEVRLRAGETKLECFIHARGNIGLLRARLSKGLLEFTIENPEYRDQADTAPVTPGSLKNLHYPPAETGTAKNCKWFVQETGQNSYGIFVKTRERKNETLMAFTVATSKEGANWREAALSRLERALNAGYECLFAAHCQWWTSFWRKSGLQLPERLFEINWYRTNYLLAACSRKGCTPMPLQGVWTADDGKLPPMEGRLSS